MVSSIRNYYFLFYLSAECWKLFFLHRNYRGS